VIFKEEMVGGREREGGRRRRTIDIEFEYRYF